MNKKQEKTRIWTLLLLGMVLCSMMVFAQSDSEGSPNAQLSQDIDVSQSSLDEGVRSEFKPALSRIAQFFSDLFSGQAFAFADPNSARNTDQFRRIGGTHGAFSMCDRTSVDNIPSATYIEGVGPVRCDADGTNHRAIKFGSQCESGDYVYLFWYPDANYNANTQTWSFGTTQRALFSQLWKKESATDNLRVTSYDVNVGRSLWWAGYNCYHKEPVTAQVAEWCGDSKINQQEKCDGTSLGGKSCTDLGYVSGTLRCSSTCAYDTSGCSNVAPTTTTGTGTTSGTGTGTISTVPSSEYGYLKSVQIPSTVFAGDSVRVTGEYVALVSTSQIPTDKVLIEANMIIPNEQGLLQPLQIASSVSSSSKCDGSEFYAGDYIFDLKAGDVVKFDYTFRAPNVEGKLPVNIQVWTECFANGGEQILFYNTGKTVTIQKRVIEEGVTDSDNDGVPDTDDNCVGTINGDQSDQDADGFGDSCDVCPRDVGIAPIGCPSCWGQGDISTCPVQPSEGTNEGGTGIGTGVDTESPTNTSESDTASSSCTLGEYKTSSCSSGGSVVSQVCVNNVWQPYRDCNGNVAESTFDSTQVGVGIGLIMLIIVGVGLILYMTRRKSRKGGLF